MHPFSLDPGATDAATIAKALIQAFGEQALPLAMRQAAVTPRSSGNADRWSPIVAAIRALLDAHSLMETALIRLDEAGDYAAAPYLENAIVSLGLRRTGDVDITGMVEAELADASQTGDVTEKRRHLDLASVLGTLSTVSSVEEDDVHGEAAVQPRPDC